MKRFDRAMYALFLLALLADFARSQVPVSLGGDAAGGLILSAAQELQVGPGDVANLVLRRTGLRTGLMSGLRRGIPAPTSTLRLQERSWTIACLVSVLSGQLDPASLAMLGGQAAPDLSGHGSPLLARESALPRVRVVFDHTGSPAP